MTTSGVANFDLQFDDLIVEAYERCGLEARSGYDMKTALRSLNIIFAEWANRGLNLWTIEQRQVTLVAGTHEYILPTDTVNVLSAVIRTNSGQSTQQDITIDRISRAEWLHTPNKNTQSRPAQFYVERSVPLPCICILLRIIRKPICLCITPFVGLRIQARTPIQQTLFFVFCLVWWLR